MKKGKTQKRLLKAVHEGARDLHKAGFIDKWPMREFDAMCRKPISPQATGNR
jgi:putative transcriptional regulator